MKRKYLKLIYVIAAITSAVIFWGRSKYFDHQALKSVMPSQVRKLMLNTDEKRKEILSNAQEIIKEEALLETSDEIEAQISEIDHILESSNAFERMNSEDLDDQTRLEFMALIEARQKLLTTLVDRELESSNELLAGTK